MQHEISHPESLFRAMADASPALIWIAGPDRGCLWFNRKWSEFTGRSLEEELGFGWTSGVHADDLDRVLAVYQGAFDARQPFEMDYRLKRHDAVYRWVLNTANPVFAADGRFKGYIGSCIDITERKEADLLQKSLLDRERAARTEAERLSRMKDEFLASLSHELRTPLNAIQLWAEVLRQSPDASLLEEGLTTIAQNTRAQTRLIEDLLDVSRLTGGGLALNLQPAAPDLIIAAALDAVRAAADEKGMTLQLERDPELPAIQADPARLQQVLENLLRNAIKFSPDRGTVTLEARRAGDRCVIRVIDSGDGIAPEFLPHLFDPFRQADASTTRRHPGLGLGLALVKGLVEAHGGQIEAHSDGIGQGSRFTVSLPIATAAAPERATPAKPPSAIQKLLDLSDKRVLVVDDDPPSRNVIRRILVECGASVDVAPGADEGDAILKDRPADLIISDIGMPQRDGYSFISDLRSAGVSTPAVALTAFVRAEDRARAREAGFQAHIPKPVDVQQFLRTLGEVLRGVVQQSS